MLRDVAEQCDIEMLEQATDNSSNSLESCRRVAITFRKITKYDYAQ